MSNWNNTGYDDRYSDDITKERFPFLEDTISEQYGVNLIDHGSLTDVVNQLSEKEAYKALKSWLSTPLIDILWTFDNIEIVVDKEDMSHTDLVDNIMNKFYQ